MKNSPEISIVVPLYNESQVFSMLTSRLTTIMDSASYPIQVVLVDDGSKDDTALLISKICGSDSRYKGVILSRNFGHQAALSAGLALADGSEGVMIIDGDLQDPPELIDTFYSKLKEGNDVVYAVRKNRKESFLKKASYNLFYRILKKVSNIEIPLDSGDFSLISRKVVNHLIDMKEESRFLRGMRSWVGFKQVGLEYERSAREAGESKYSLKALIKLSLNGIFNFSEYPIKFITSLGFVLTFISFSYLAYVLIDKLINNTAPQGFTAIVFLICLFGGFQLLAIGILGEYIVRIFFQVKERPLYVVKEVVQI